MFSSYNDLDFDIEDEIYELMDLMSEDENDHTGAITKERIDAHIDELVEVLNLFVAYPDNPAKNSRKAHHPAEVSLSVLMPRSACTARR